MEIEGYRLPVHRALSAPVLTAGVPRNIAIANGTLTAALTFGLHSWYALPFCVVLHIACVVATRYEPQWPELLRRSLNLKHHYKP